MILLAQRQKLATIENVLLLFILIAALGFVSQGAKSWGRLLADSQKVAQASSFPKNLPDTPAPIIEIKANAAITMRNGAALFTANEDDKLPVASLTKLMTALVVLERYDLGYPVAITKNAMAQVGEQGGLTLGETLSVKDLLYITLIESSNRAAYALSELMGNGEFVAMMNTRARELGMEATHFEDSTGLNAGSYSTAKDIALLSNYLFNTYPLFGSIIGAKEFSLYAHGRLHHKLLNTNKLLGQDGVIGGKTGWTNEAKGCLMVIQKNKDEYSIHVVLGAQDRFEEMKKLIQTQ